MEVKFHFLLTCEVTDTWAATATSGDGLQGRAWCEQAIQYNLADTAIRCLPATPDFEPRAFVDPVDSPDHAHASYILRSGWPAHGAPAFPGRCGYCDEVITTVQAAVGHRCGAPKSSAAGLMAGLRRWPFWPLHVVLLLLFGFATWEWVTLALKLRALTGK